MKGITVIVPIHELNDEYKSLLTIAITSFHETKKDNENIMFVSNGEIIAELKSIYGGKGYEYLVSDDTTYIRQINFAVSNVKTDYFSILEFDDIYNDIWFDEASKYMGEYDASIYLPLTEACEYNHIEDGSIGYFNEAVWASAFSEKLGYYDIESFKDYLNFSISGGIFRTKDFIEDGMLKESMKIVCWYEYILRAMKNNHPVFVVPKIGYFHTVNRVNSATDIYNKTLTQESYEWLLEYAKKSYIYKTDKNENFE